jgi:hypothetical protein
VTTLTLPRLPRGRPTQGGKGGYNTELQAFCGQILEIKSTSAGVNDRAWFARHFGRAHRLRARPGRNDP